MEFPEDFFKKECRCGFEVPEMMKRAWAAQMEVLEVVGKVCEKHHYSIMRTGELYLERSVIRDLFHGMTILISV